MYEHLDVRTWIFFIFRKHNSFHFWKLVNNYFLNRWNLYSTPKGGVRTSFVSPPIDPLDLPSHRFFSIKQPPPFFIPMKEVASPTDFFHRPNTPPLGFIYFPLFSPRSIQSPILYPSQPRRPNPITSPSRFISCGGRGSMGGGRGSSIGGGA